MGSDPAVLFYTSDWLSGTLLLSFEQKGQYIDLLCIQHQIYPEHIPKDRMMIVCSSYDNPVFKKFTQDDIGNYYNERMEIEIEKRISYCESRKLASHSRKSIKDRTIHHMINRTIHRTENDNDNDNKDVIKSKKEGMQGETIGPSPDETVFEIFRTAYPGTKRGLKTEYDNFRKKHGDHKNILPVLSVALSNQKQWRVEMAAAGMFIPEWPGLSVWINQRRWELEKPVIENKKNSSIPQCDFQRKAAGKYDNLPKTSN